MRPSSMRPLPPRMPPRRKRADQAHAPLRLENAVVLQLLTDRDRIAELTVMPAVLSTTIDRDALSLHGATTLVWVGRSVGPRPLPPAISRRRTTFSRRRARA